MSRLLSAAAVALGCASALPSDVLLSQQARADHALTADPGRPEWQFDAPVVADRDRYGQLLPNARTEVRSHWTKNALYFLFVCHYETMYLKPNPSTTTETWGLWDWDVAEVFIGSDLSNIHVYKEFEVSPQGEWVDLAVDRSKASPVDWTWNSGFTFKTRVDASQHVWFCEMRLPWKAIDPRTPVPGNELRLNLYRLEGAPSNRKFITWQPVHAESFHTPQAFGRLQLRARASQ